MKTVILWNHGTKREPIRPLKSHQQWRPCKLEPHYKFFYTRRLFFFRSRVKNRTASNSSFQWYFYHTTLVILIVSKIPRSAPDLGLKPDQLDPRSVKALFIPFPSSLSSPSLPPTPKPSPSSPDNLRMAWNNSRKSACHSSVLQDP